MTLCPELVLTSESGVLPTITRVRILVSYSPLIGQYKQCSHLIGHRYGVENAQILIAKMEICKDKNERLRLFSSTLWHVLTSTDFVWKYFYHLTTKINRQICERDRTRTFLLAVVRLGNILHVFLIGKAWKLNFFLTQTSNFITLICEFLTFDFITFLIGHNKESSTPS